MRNDIIGENAGLIWRALYHSEKELNIKNLIDVTHLNVVEISAAIGWLARENKILIRETDNEFLFTVFKECYY